MGNALQACKRKLRSWVAQRNTVQSFQGAFNDNWNGQVICEGGHHYGQGH